MLAANSAALKEWASVCLSLETGRSALLLRKGGLVESAGEFRLEHAEFWLYPTQFHQSREQLSADWASSVGSILPPPAGEVQLSLYAVVHAVDRITEERQLERFRGLHVLADDVVRQRFHYRQPGLTVAAVEIYRRARPVVVQELGRYAGCHSWVDLEAPIPTAELEAVSDEALLSQAVAAVSAGRG